MPRRRLACAVRSLIAAGVLLAAAAAPAVAQPSAPAAGSFHLIFTDSFNGTSLAGGWTQYNGREGGCCPQTIWARTHLHVSGGVLTMDIGKDPAYGGAWVGAGISQGRSLLRTYGEWNVRFRMTRGTGTAMCMLLTPKSSTPTAIDFAEESPAMGATRSEETSTLHYGSSMIHNHVTGDFTQWHVMGVQWTPGRLVYTLDGRTWAVTTGSHVPTVPLHLAIQTESGPKGSVHVSPDASTPNPVQLQIDWVQVYSYS
jgi:beta-glucanase (GH16 family)